MSTAEITAKLTELQEYKRLTDELQAQIDALTDEIKAAMGDTEQITAGPYKVTWKPVTTTRIDTAALKKELPGIAERYMKTSTVRRFTVT